MKQLPHEPRLTKSRISAFFECPRKHYILYELGLRPPTESTALRMGSAFHLGMEVADARGEEEAVQRVRREYQREKPRGVPQQEWSVEMAKVVAMLYGHFWRWRDSHHIEEVVATEEAFEIPLRNPTTGYPSRTWTLAGKRDRIIRHAEGGLALQEYKTTSSKLEEGGDYWDGLSHDLQVSLYWLACLEDGYDIRRVLYDVARKPQLQPKMVTDRDEQGRKIIVDENGDRVYKQNGEPRKSRSSKKGYKPRRHRETPDEYALRLMDDIQDRPDYYYARKLLYRNETQLRTAHADVWHTAKLIRRCELKDRWPHNWKACTRFGKCKCWDLCNSGWEPRDGVPRGWRQVDDVHQELTGDGENG